MSDILRELTEMNPHASGEADDYCFFCYSKRAWNMHFLWPRAEGVEDPYTFTRHEPTCLWYRACLEVAARGLLERIRVPPPQRWVPIEEP